MPAVVWAEIGSPSRGMAQVGSASALGAEGRRFKSGYPDRQIQKGPRTMAGALLYAVPAGPFLAVPFPGGAGQPCPPARKATHASLIRSAWPLVNMSMQESCE